MSSSPARFTAYGSFVSVPMETAARAMGVGAYSDPELAWTALRGVRRRNAEKAADEAGSTIISRVGHLFASDAYDADLNTENDENGARGYFPGAPGTNDMGSIPAVYFAEWTGNVTYSRRWIESRVTRTLKARRHSETRQSARIYPPIMGGSPYASPNTGWHAEGCLCRRCSL